MPDIRIVFMGTPDFAVYSLQNIIDCGYKVSAVITSEDKQSGRGLKVHQSAVKKCAIKHNLKVLQPQKLKNQEFIEELKALNANLFIVVAFRMLPEIIWNMPKYGTINLHASLLPQYRGAAPINWAIINGEKKSGVTTFFIEKEIDTGNIIAQEEVNIEPNENAGELHDKLMKTGGKLIIETIKKIEKGNLETIKQENLKIENSELKLAPKIYKPDCRISWSNSVISIYNFIRGLSPYPAAWTRISNGNKSLILKIFKSDIIEGSINLKPGEFSTDVENQLTIYASNGALNIIELQLEGKKRMYIKDFLRGFNMSDYHIE